MKKMKKLFAILMTMAMVMGLGITGFAAESVDIVVNNLETDTTVKAVQVIEPDSTKETGWDFVENANIKNAYATAFGKDNPTEQDYQDIIWSLIKYVDDDNANIPDRIKDAATPTQINGALNAIADATYDLSVKTDTTNTFTVSDAGVYAIKATPEEGSDTVYNPMAAYVSFTYTNGIPTLPDDDVTVNAKKTDVPVEKTVIEDPNNDNATGIGKTVKYEVKTAVPYLESTSEWKFTDTITGASYVKNDDGMVPVQVTVGTDSATEYLATITAPTEGDESFVLDLSGLLTKENRGKEVKFTYQAVVTGTKVNNTIQYDDDHTSGEVELYTGTINFTKYAEDEETTLNGAEFVVYRVNANNKKEYAVFTAEENSSDYTLVKWINEDDINENNQPTTVVTRGEGALSVSGLDKGTTYYFEETKAPEGYSLNKIPSSVTFDSGKVDTIFTEEGSMKDTKISELPLPETGGMGTTLFTIAGCVIMISAAGLFFATRKKAN